MIYKNSVLSFTGVLHTSVQSLVWLLLSLLADLSSGEPKCTLQPVEETVKCYSAMRKSRQTKVLSGWFGSSDVVMLQEGTPVYLYMNGSWACGTQCLVNHIVVRSRHSLANILQFLIYWYLCSSKIPIAWKQKVVKWGSVPCKPGTNSSCLIFSKIMKPLLNIDLVRRKAR